MSSDFPPSQVTRRAFLGVGASLASVSLLAACTSGAATNVKSGDVTVPIWSNAPDFTKFFAKRAALMSKSGKYQYKVTSLQSSADDVTTKALAAYAANGTIPGLLGIEIGSFSRFMKNNIAGDALLDLTGKLGSPRSDFYSSRVDPYVNEKKIYAMESQFSLVTLYKRTDLWDKFKIPTADTWDDYVKIGGSVHEKHGVSLGVIATNDPTWFGILLQQRGGHFFDADGSLAIDSPEAVEVLQLLVDGAKNGAFTVVSDFFGGPGTSLLKQGKSAAYFMPDWFNSYTLQTSAPEQKGLWHISPLPRFAGGGHSTSVDGGTGFAISKNSNVRSAALALLQNAYGTQAGQVDRFQTIGYLPTLKSAWDDPAVNNKTDAYLGGQRIMEIYKPLAADAPTQYQNANFSILNNELGAAITAALTGKKSPAKAIKDAAAGTKRQSQ